MSLRSLNRSCRPFGFLVAITSTSACTGPGALLPDAGPPACERQDTGQESGVVTTVAGGGVGTLDGHRSIARFSAPMGLAFGPDGTLYIADSANDSIRALGTDERVTTAAGGVRGSIDGSLSSAAFWSPFGVAVTAAQTLVVADTGNHRIRKVDLAAGTVTTLAGSSTGNANGTGAVARFSMPSAVTTQINGAVLVADSGNHSLRRVAANGDTQTFAGRSSAGLTDGDSVTAQFNAPAGVAIDAQGNVYVADTENHAIRKIAAGGTVTTLAGNGLPGSCDGNGNAARFRFPTAVAVDSAGNVYVADSLNHLIRRITPSGDVDTVAGSTAERGTDDGRGSAARFDSPSGLALSATGGLYVADTGNNRIRLIQP